MHDGAGEEVDVGVSPKLKKEGEGEEGDDIVFSCGDVIGSCLLLSPPRNINQKLSIHSDYINKSGILPRGFAQIFPHPPHL